MRNSGRSVPGAIAVFVILAACADIKQPEGHEPPAGHDPHSGPAMNYHAIDRQLATGGHFVGDGLDRLAAKGLQVIIDLRDTPPSGQKQKLEQQGVEWVSVPIDYDNPVLEDFKRFKTAMNDHTTGNLLVQCSANYRASAMTYLYRVLVGNVPEQEALRDLHAVWEPNDVWSNFIHDVKFHEQN